MRSFKYSLLLFAVCFSIPLLAQPTPHKRVHPKAAALPFHDMGGWGGGECGAAQFYAIRYLCQCLTGKPNPKPFAHQSLNGSPNPKPLPNYSLPGSSSFNLDLTPYANQPMTRRPEAKASAFRPKANAFAFGWSCLAGDDGDIISCVYDVKRATLTSTSYEGSNLHASKHRLYHVTLSVLEAVAREPIDLEGSMIDFGAPFALLLKYGAKLKP